MTEPLPFDLHVLRSFVMVAETSSFTRAGEEAGLSQGSISRQIQTLEEQLGVQLLERSTRSLRLTEAGQLFLDGARRILGSAQDTRELVASTFGDAPDTLRVGLDRSLGLAPIPGLFVGYRQKFPKVRLRVEAGSGEDLLAGLNSWRLEVSVLPARPTWPSGIVEIGRYHDPFALIVPPGKEAWLPETKLEWKTLMKSTEVPWILPSEQSETGRQIAAWFKDRHQISPSRAMETDDFDFTVSLVSLGLGVALVPARVLPIYARRRDVRRVEVPEPFVREVSVITRTTAAKRLHVTAFAEAVLFRS